MNSTKGSYEVKLGYRFLQDRNSNTNFTHSSGWGKIWKLNIPQKLKIMLWRFFINNLPIINLLHSKGVSVPTICPACEEDVEHLLHIFFDCRFVAQCWKYNGISFDMSTVESAPLWLLDRLSTESHDKNVTISAVILGIWFVRNKENQMLMPKIVVDWSMNQIEEWKEAI